MAASPEDSVGQGAFPAEPFSPSVFLDLPPTPRPDGGGGADDPASSDDLVLPYISRMLMEDDIDDKFFYQYPDHPVLLQAQQPYAKILSDATTGSSSSSDSATANADGSGVSTLSPPSSSEASASGAATWPYDPIEVAQLLRSPPYPDMEVGLDGFTADEVNAFLPAQGGAGDGFQQSPTHLGNASSTGDNGAHSPASPDEEETKAKSTTNVLSADGDEDALVSAFFSGQDRESVDMLNLAFLKGMEEARKFLPTNNNLLVDLDATSGDHLPRDSQVKNEETVDGTLIVQRIGNGRGRKNRHDWDYLEAEAGRNSKLMMPEPEENGELVDKIVINGYELCLKEMQGLRIAMDSETEKNNRKGDRKSGKGRQSTNQVVDFHTLLIHCAQAVATGDSRSAIELLRQIKQHSSPSGDATQRLAHCFAEGLEARLAGTGSQVYKSLMSKRTSVMEYLKAYKLYLAACCFKMMAFKFSNKTIRGLIARRKKVHIVDYGMHFGFQWPTFLRCLAEREGGPPEVRITGIDLPQPGFRPAARLEEIGRRLSNCAHQFRVPFKFHSIAAKWDTVQVDDLNIDPDEVLIVNSIVHFGNLLDEGSDVDSLSPRDVVLNNIRKMRPDAFILVVMNGAHNSPFFVARFREALFYYSAMFDMLDATTPRDNEHRLLVERDLFGRSALNVIACEGLDRVERPETYKQWQARNQRAGLRPMPLDPDVVKEVREAVRSQYHKDFVIDMDHQWLLEGWKGRVLYAMSTWVADDSIPEL
ncbi:hypothetical protein ACP70R_007948 [Stipagrostis hirtigluma subsp. patula]